MLDLFFSNSFFITQKKGGIMIKTIMLGLEGPLGRVIYEKIIQSEDFELQAVVTRDVLATREIVYGFPVLDYCSEFETWRRCGAQLAIIHDDAYLDFSKKGNLCFDWLNVIICADSIMHEHIVNHQKEIAAAGKRTHHTFVVIDQVPLKTDLFWQRFIEILQFWKKKTEIDFHATADNVEKYGRATIGLNNIVRFELIYPDDISVKQLNYRSNFNEDR